MAGTIWLGAARNQNSVTAASSTRYSALGNCAYLFSSDYTTESLAQQTCRFPGTVSNMRARCPTNTQTTNTTVTFRKAGADASPTFTITAATTGTFQDTTNTVSLADGDLYDIKVVTGTDGTSLHIAYLYCDFAVTGDVKERICSSNDTVNQSAASTTSYNWFAGFPSVESVEAEADIPWRTGTASNFLMTVLSNARTTTTTFRFRKNTADGNQVVTFGSGVTGRAEDTSNTDSITIGDQIAQSCTTGTGTGTLTYGTTSIVFEHGDNKQTVMAAGVFADTGTFYVPLYGGGADASTEAAVQFPIPLTRVMSDMQVDVFSNSSTSTCTFRSRVNGGNGNLSISIGSGVTGTLSDTSNSDSFTAGDLINYQASGHNAAITIFSVTSLIAEAAGGLAVNLAGSGGLAGMGGLAGFGGGLVG